MLQGKRILVTGGTGSLGKILVKRLLSGEMGTPEKVVVFSRDEGKQHAMRLAFLHQQVATDEVIYQNFLRLLEFRIGDIRDYADVCLALRDIDIVFNAAALKQVPTCEYFPHQAVLTNCIGAQNITRAISELRLPVEKVIGISTDKACKPVNVMGLTKAIQERIFIAANIMAPQTQFICVRYGNVLASRGSVIPLFLEQIRQQRPLTITDHKMTRFLLSLNQAVDTVFAAVCLGRAGEIFIPIAPAATMINVARALIGSKPLSIEVTGVRPGEKMHEIMISEEEIHHTVRRENYFVILPMLPELQKNLPEKPVLFKEYSSSDHVLSLQETVELMTQHHLMPHQQKYSHEELLC